MLSLFKILTYFFLELYAQEIPREIAALGERFIPNGNFESEMKATCQSQELEKSNSKIKWVINGKFIPGVGSINRTSLRPNSRDSELQQNILMKAINIDDQNERNSFITKACADLTLEEKVRLARSLFGMLGTIYDSSKVLANTDNQITIQSQYAALKDYYINQNPNARSAVCRHAAVAVSDLLSHCGVQSKSEVYITAGNAEESVDINDFIPKDYRPSDYQKLGFTSQEAYIQNYYLTHGFKNAAEFEASYRAIYEKYRDDVKRASPDFFAGAHQAVTVQDPNSNAKYSINWRDLEKVESSFAGLQTYLSSDGIRNTGLGNWIYSPEGKLQGYIRTDLGNLVGRAFDDQQAAMSVSPYDYLEVSATADRPYADYKIKQVVANAGQNHFSSTSFLISDDSGSDDKSFLRYQVGILYFIRKEKADNYGDLEQRGGVLLMDMDYIRSLQLLKKQNQLSLNLGAGFTSQPHYIESKTQIVDDGGFAPLTVLRPSLSLQFKNEEHGLSARATALVNMYATRDTHPLTDEKRFVVGTQNTVLSAELNKKLSGGKSLGAQFRSIKNLDHVNNQYILHYLHKNTKLDLGISHFKILEAQEDALIFIQAGHAFEVFRIPANASFQLQQDLKGEKSYVGGGLQMILNSGSRKEAQ